MPKATTPTTARHGRRHNPLEDDILATGILKSSKSPKRKKTDDEDRDNYVESKASKQILRLGRELVEEDKERTAAAETSRGAFDPESARRLDFGDDDDELEAPGAFDDEAFGDDDDDAQGDFGGDVEVDDLDTFNKFMPSTSDNPLSGWLADGDAEEEAKADGQGTNLADLILAKIAQHEAREQYGRGADAEPFEEDYELPPKVIEVYTQ
jgi:essential nuclear protein 1